MRGLPHEVRSRDCVQTLHFWLQRVKSGSRVPTDEEVALMNFCISHSEVGRPICDCSAWHRGPTLEAPGHGILRNSHAAGFLVCRWEQRR